MRELGRSPLTAALLDWVPECLVLHTEASWCRRLTEQGSPGLPPVSQAGGRMWTKERAPQGQVDP